MARPLSQDLRDRIVAAVHEGASKRSVADRFDVVPSTVVKLMQRVKMDGTNAPRPCGGDQRSGEIEAHADEIKALIAAQVDITLVEIAAELKRKHARAFAPSVIWRLLDRHDVTFKKNRTRE